MTNSKMATDERNFRSSYYEKVGCHSVEEKSLNKLLQDSCRDLPKLKQFCLTYTVSTAQRSLLWNIILGVLPLHKNSTEYILQQRTDVFNDLLRAVTIMQYIDETTTQSQIMHTMFLVESKRLMVPIVKTLEEEKDFVEIVKVLMQIFDSDVEIYWIAKEFYVLTREILRECSKLKDLTQMLLKREDIVLHNQLEKLLAFEAVHKWYGTCFASVISESALVKVWDKICGGSQKIVVFIFLEIVKTLRESVMKCTTQKDLICLIEQVKDQDAAIVNKAIKTWQSNKNHSEITVH